MNTTPFPFEGPNMRYTIPCLSATICASTIAHSDIVQVDEFQSIHIEGFDNLQMSNGSGDIMGGLGTIQSTHSQGYINRTGGWYFHSNVRAHEGSWLVGTSSYGVEYSFNSIQHSFGGFFASISDSTEAQIEFIHGDTVLETMTFNTADPGTWGWAGWSSDEAFDSVRIVGDYGPNGGFIMHDAIRVSTAQIPASSTYAMIAGGILLIGRRRR